MKTVEERIAELEARLPDPPPAFVERAVRVWASIQPAQEAA